MAAARKPAAAKSKAAAARAETNGDDRTLEFEGLTLTLPSKLPFRALRHIRKDGIEADIGFLEDMLGPEQMEKVWALDIDVGRGEELVVAVMGAYGTDAGESGASTNS